MRRGGAAREAALGAGAALGWGAGALFLSGLLGGVAFDVGFAAVLGAALRGGPARRLGALGGAALLASFDAPLGPALALACGWPALFADEGADDTAARVRAALRTGAAYLAIWLIVSSIAAGFPPAGAGAMAASLGGVAAALA
ncbi:MAG: hypothetical protein SF028_12380, partial [Candidatus Sumerlaeia bacterium]|nr:hypothetical protein [Candidatus Sumerlaeia bacterium]